MIYNQCTHKRPEKKITPRRPSQSFKGSLAQALCRSVSKGYCHQEGFKKDPYLQSPKIVGLGAECHVSASLPYQSLMRGVSPYAELIKPTSHELSAMPNSSGKDKFAPLAPVLSQPLRCCVITFASVTSRGGYGLLDGRAKGADGNGIVKISRQAPWVWRKVYFD